jgi:hypothetical protein
MDERLKKPTGREHSQRAMDDRAVTENRNLSDTVRREDFRSLFRQEVLPNLPPIDGYHVMWASTNNPRDPIIRRLQAGYQIVTAEDVPGFESLSTKTGEYAGAIGINEMIALKCPDDLYRAMMKHFHHDLPREEEQRRDAILDVVREQAAARGLKVLEGEAVAEPEF